MSKTIAIKDHEGLCWNCLQTKDNVRKIEITELGYGSGFDGCNTEIHLCEECYQKSGPKLWTLNVIVDKDEQGHFMGEEYEFEKEIFEFISQMPVQGKQFIFNEFEVGWNANPKMDPQDWIDYEEGCLSFEKCKEYGLYAHEEVNAYKDRFPVCEHPVNRVYKDGSCGAWCPYGANGRKDQKIDLNVSEECYLCKHFKVRETSRKEIKNEDWNDYKIFVLYGDKMDALRDKFED